MTGLAVVVILSPHSRNRVEDTWEMVLDALKTKVPFEPTGWTLAVSLLQLLMLGLAASRSTGGFEPVEPIEELRGQRPGVVAHATRSGGVPQAQRRGR